MKTVDDSSSSSIFSPADNEVGSIVKELRVESQTIYPPRNKKIVKVKKPKLLSNPIYAVEEFTYLPDPTDDLENNEVESHPPRLRVPKSLNLTHPTVTNSIFIDNFDNLRKLNFKLTEDNRDEDNKTLKETLTCSEFEEKGYCIKDNSYPHDMVTDLVSNCSILSSFSAFVPEDVDTLGDNSDSIISSEKDSDRPWSWRVSAYNKKQVCDSYLSFIRPSYVLDSRG